MKAATYLQGKINRAVHAKAVAATPAATVVPVSVVVPVSQAPVATAEKSDPMEDLKRRLANGEITSEEFERLKAIIN